MQEEIKKCEEISLSVRGLSYGDTEQAENNKNELIKLVVDTVPEKEKYIQQLKSLNFNQATTSQTKDYWQVQQQNLLQLINAVQEEIRLKQKQQLQEKNSKKQIEDLQLELLRTKNDNEKDLILEKNNHQYLKKKYDILKVKHEELEKSHQSLLGSKNHWYYYFLVTFPLVFLILTFDTFIFIGYFNLLKFTVLVKTAIAFAVISGLLYIPLRDKRLLVLPVFFIAVILILQLF